MLLRTISVSALLVLAATAPGQAADLNDPAGRFTASYPDGWTPVSNVPPPAVFMITKDAGDGTRSVCTVAILATPASTSKNQKDIDDEISRSNTNDNIKAAYAQQGFKDVVVDKQSERPGDGHVVHQIFLSMTLSLPNGATAPLKVFEELHAFPGQIHDLGCLTKPENYAKVEPDFLSIGLGYHPKSALVAQIDSPSATLVTLFADARFQGSRRPISGDTPDVARVGWTGRTGSLGLADATPWQVCESSNYAGRCMVLTASLAGQANTHFPVGSLRRLASPALPASAQVRSATGRSAVIGAGGLFRP